MADGADNELNGSSPAMVEGQPSSTNPLQLSSTLLHNSGAPGYVVATAASQSVLFNTNPIGCVHAN